MIDDADDADERCTVLFEKRQVARVQHRCKECRRPIEKGETYLNERLLFEGRVTTHKTCSHCLVARQWLAAECGGWIYEGVKEDIAEHVDELTYPFEVKLLYIGMKRQWKTKQGTSWRLPKLPQTTHQRMAL